MNRASDGRDRPNPSSEQVASISIPGRVIRVPVGSGAEGANAVDHCIVCGAAAGPGSTDRVHPGYVGLRLVHFHERCVPFMRLVFGPAGDVHGWPGGKRPDRLGVTGSWYRSPGCDVCGEDFDRDDLIVAMNHNADMDLPMHLRLHRSCAPHFRGR